MSISEISDACPAYGVILDNYKEQIRKKFDLELEVEFDDHSNSSIRFWLKKNRFEFMRQDDEQNSDAFLLLDDLNNLLAMTCSQCGCDTAVSFRSSIYNWNQHCINQMNLCEECYSNFGNEESRLSSSTYIHFAGTPKHHFYKLMDEKKLVEKGIRYINPFGEFDYAKFGSYFFFRDGIYAITEDIKYKDFEIEKEYFDSIFHRHNCWQQFIIKVTYAGHDTGFIDDQKIKIFTGDILLIKGSYSKDRIPHKYFLKDRYEPIDGGYPFECIGVVSAYSICYEAYQVVLDNHGAFLCHGREMEVLGNIFYDLVPNERINIWNTATQIALSAYDPNGFWSIHTLESIRDDLKKIKTPSYRSSIE